jgi:outer membrane lipoprotein LolB
VTRTVLALLAAVLLASCAAPRPVANAQSWTSGRLSVRIEATATRPAQSVSADFELRGDDAGGELHLNSPLGTRLASARWEPGQAWLQAGDGERPYPSLDALSQDALGEVLPLVAWPDWLAGRPWAGAPHRAFEQGFEQLGWRVLLEHRAEGRIEARRESPPAIVLRVRLDAAAT